MESSSKVFLSYSHDSEEHKAWVRTLATELRLNGVDVILDQWDLQLGSDLRLFMERGLSCSNLVLCICSDSYVQKANASQGGTGYESMIITQALLSDSSSDYVIPIIRNNKSVKKTPIAIASKLYIDFDDNAQYSSNFCKLLDRIYGKDMKMKPDLGKNPYSEGLATAILENTRIESTKYCSPQMSGEVSFRFDNNNGNYNIGIGEYQFVTRWSRSGNDSIHVYGSIGFLPEVDSFPPINRIPDFDFTSSYRSIKKGQIIIYMNKGGHFAAIKLGEVKSSGHGNLYDEMHFTYKIYNDYEDSNH